MKDAWDGPVLRYFYITMLLSPLIILTLLAITMREVLGGLTTFTMVIGATYVPIFFVMFLARGRFMEEWNSDRRFVAIDFQEARIRLEAVLTSSGLSHERVTEGNPQMGIKYRVKRGLGIELLQGADKDHCAIYVWPVNDLTRRDIEGLKRRIDAAFPPAK